MPDIQISDYCKDNERIIGDVSRGLLAIDPDCPRGNLFNSGIFFTPNSPAYRDLAGGDLKAVTFKHWDEGNIFDEWGTGPECPTECAKLEQVKDRAALQMFNRCISQEHLIRLCSGNNDEDWFSAILSFMQESERCEIERRALCSLLGIYNAAASITDNGIVHSLIDNPLDGTTTNFTMAGINAAYGELNADADDIIIVPHQVAKKLEREGFTPFCCTNTGQQRNQITRLVGPKGEEFYALPKKLSKLLEVAPGQYLMIMAQRNSIAYLDGSNPRSTTGAYNTFRQFVVDDTACEGTKAYMWRRAVIDPKFWSWQLPSEACPSIDHAALASADSWAYAPVPDESCGLDHSCFQFLLGTCA